jgi:hypothetical protein
MLHTFIPALLPATSETELMISLVGPQPPELASAFATTQRGGAVGRLGT